MVSLYLHRIDSPIGELLAVTNHVQELCALQFADHHQHFTHSLHTYYHPYTLHACDAPMFLVDALTHYFNGQCDALTTLPVHMPGTPFQQRVWSLLRTLPPGTTSTYGELARQLGSPGAARAVGTANAANPIALVIACHRIIAKDGKLTGFAWGLERKRWLLLHEKTHAMS
jgi:methylated-DNA-[protein]-cysteine S-methyltransferase